MKTLTIKELKSLKGYRFTIAFFINAGIIKNEKMMIFDISKKSIVDELIRLKINYCSCDISEETKHITIIL